MITGGISIATLASGVALPVGIALSGTSLLLSLATVITRKSSKTFTVKQETLTVNFYCRLLAQSKIGRTANIIWQAKQDGDISPIQLYKVLQEVRKYRKLKADIINQAKAKAKQITKEQREELLQQGRKKGKEDFLEKIANTSSIQDVSVI